MAAKNSEFTDRLEQVVEKSGLSNPAFAGKAGITYSTFMGYLGRSYRGKVPEWDQLVKIAGAGNVSVDWLLTGENFVTEEELDLVKAVKELDPFLRRNLYFFVMSELNKATQKAGKGKREIFLKGIDSLNKAVANMEK